MNSACLFQADELSAPDQRKIKEWQRHCKYYSGELQKTKKKNELECKEDVKEEEESSEAKQEEKEVREVRNCLWQFINK